MKYYLDKVHVEEKEILYRLLEYSLYEESLYDGNEMNEQALFEYKSFDNYFNDKDKLAFFIKEQQSNKLLGFVMMNINSEINKIVEFMIIPKYRKKHIGKQIAFECFNMFKGNWEVSPSFGSDQAYIFWDKVIKEYTNYVKFIDGKFIFNNKNRI